MNRVPVLKLSGEAKRQLKLLGGILVTAAAVYFFLQALKGLQISDVLEAGINWPLSALSAALFDLATLVRALAFPFGIEKGMSVMEAWQVVAIGNAANMLLPFRAGEGVRLAVFPQRYSAADRVRLSLITGMTDVAIILLLTFAAVSIAGFRNRTYMLFLRLAGYGFTAFCALLLLLLFAVPKTRPHVLAYLNRGTLDMALWTVLSWVVMVGSMWVAFLSFGYEPLRALALTFGAYAGLNLVCLIPSSPGNLGVFEYAVVLGMAGLGVARVPAQTAGLLLHVIQYAGLLPLGGILYARFLWSRGREETRRPAKHAVGRAAYAGMASRAAYKK